MTTDHMGKILAMKTINTAKLPSMAPQTTKPAISLKKEIVAMEN